MKGRIQSYGNDAKDNLADRSCRNRGRAGRRDRGGLVLRQPEPCMRSAGCHSGNGSGKRAGTRRDNAETGVLFELIAHRYERGSLVITSNHPFSTWGSIFVDETMAVAAADRLIHHGYMFELKGESYRKKTAKAVTSAA